MLIKNYSKVTLIVCICSVWSLMFSTLGYAAAKEIITEGTYFMGDGDTLIVAEERALLNAKQTALEEAGTYVESYSETQNYKLTTDEVKVIASGVMSVAVLDKQRIITNDRISIWVKIKAIVTTDRIEDMAQKVQEKAISDKYDRLQKEYQKSQQEIVALRMKLGNPVPINNGIQKDWYHIGQGYDLSGDKKNAIYAYQQFLKYATPDQQLLINSVKQRLIILLGNEEMVENKVVFVGTELVGSSSVIASVENKTTVNSVATVSTTNVANSNTNATMNTNTNTGSTSGSSRGNSTSSSGSSGSSGGGGGHSGGHGGGR